MTLVRANSNGNKDCIAYEASLQDVLNFLGAWNRPGSPTRLDQIQAIHFGRVATNTSHQRGTPRDTPDIEKERQPRGIP